MKLKTKCTCGCEINFTKKDIRNGYLYSYQSYAYEIGTPKILNTTKKSKKNFFSQNDYDVFIDFEIELEREEKIIKQKMKYIQCPLCKRKQEECTDIIKITDSISVKKVTIKNYKIISDSRFIGFKDCFKEISEDDDSREYDIDFDFDIYGMKKYYYRYNLNDHIDVSDIDAFTPNRNNIYSFKNKRNLPTNITKDKYLELKKEFLK